MKEIYYTYNNEAIASCIFLSILQQNKSLDISRAFLILPFLFDEGIVECFQKHEVVKLEDLISKKRRFFSAFNKRYLNLMPVAINSLILLNKSNQIILGNEISIKSEISFKDFDLGERFTKINSSVSNFLKMLDKHSTLSLYSILNIQL